MVITRNHFKLAVLPLCVVLLLSEAAAAQSAVPEPDAAPASSASAAEPMSGDERARWIAASTIGPESLLVGVLSAGWGTWRGNPPEYGGKFDGFAKRYGMRLTGVSIGNSIEGALGAIWDEDPRYRRSPSPAFFARVGHAAKLTVMAPDARGNLRPAYARYAGNVGNNFLTNAWRVESESSVKDALVRSAVGVAGRFGANLFDEFWPDVRRLLPGGRNRETGRD